MRVLVVDDDPEIVSFIRRGLTLEGYTVDTASDGIEALAKVRDNRPELVVLDVMMPGMEGTEVSRRLRQQSDIPILMLTAKASVADRVTGLDSGADDYLVKPFAFDELLARIRALLRRTQPQEPVELRFADLSLNTETREARRGDNLLDLTTQEFDLLELFMRHPKQVLRRDTIYQDVWGYEYDHGSNVLEVYIRYLRAKLEAGSAKRLIHTVRGVGYVLRE